MTDEHTTQQADQIKHRCEAMQQLTHEFTQQLVMGLGNKTNEVNPVEVVELAQGLAEAQLQFMHRLADDAQTQIENLNSPQSPDDEEENVVTFPHTKH